MILAIALVFPNHLTTSPQGPLIDPTILLDNELTSKSLI